VLSCLERIWALPELIKSYQHIVSSIFNRAKHGRVEQAKDKLPLHVKALNAVVQCFWDKCNTDLSVNGGKIYAELT
jgi:hypothetical protein